jgi:Flp pilus assembly protein TadG
MEMWNKNGAMNMRNKSNHRPERRTQARAVRHRRAPRRGLERGVSTLEVSLMLPFLLLLLLGVFDFAQMFHLAIEVSSAARAGAQYGYQNSATQIDTSGMIAAAEGDTSDVITWGDNTASYGCMCSDGTNQNQIASSNASSTSLCPIAPSTCTSNGTQLVNYVQVQTQASFTPVFPWPGVPSSVTLNGNAMYWAAQ